MFMIREQIRALYTQRYRGNGHARRMLEIACQTIADIRTAPPIKVVACGTSFRNSNTQTGPKSVSVNDSKASTAAGTARPPTVKTARPVGRDLRTVERAVADIGQRNGEARSEERYDKCTSGSAEHAGQADGWHHVGLAPETQRYGEAGEP